MPCGMLPRRKERSNADTENLSTILSEAVHAAHRGMVPRLDFEQEAAALYTWVGELNARKGKPVNGFQPGGHMWRRHATRASGPGVGGEM